MESHLLASPFPFPQTKAQSGLADLPHGASGKVGSSRPGILNFGRVSVKNKGRGEFGVFPIRRMYKYICHMPNTFRLSCQFTSFRTSWKRA